MPPIPFPTPLEVGALDTIATPGLWAWTIGGVVALFVVDFLFTRRPHEVSM